MDYKPLHSSPPPYPGTAPPHDVLHHQPQAQQHVHQPQPQQHHMYQPMVMMTPAPILAPAPPPAPVVQTNVVVNVCGSDTLCPRCNARIRVTAKYHPSWKTYCFSALLFLVGCWPCVCYPCCAKSCYKTSQYCPKCKFCLASY